MSQVACRLCALSLALHGFGALAQNTAAARDAATEPAMLERIRSASDSETRIQLMSRFVELFPRSKSLLPVLKGLQSEYVAGNELSRAITVGQRAMELYPADVEAAENSLKVAERLSDAALIRKFAIETWRRAAWLKNKPGAEGRAARESMDFAESQLAYMAVQEANAGNRELAMETLAHLNPDSAYLPNLNTTADRLANTAIPRTPPAGNAELAAELEDADTLLAEAERLTRRGTNYGKVFEYSQRALKVLGEQTGPPPGADASAWQSKYDRQLTAAYWMSGMAATFIGRYQTADRDLRAALPSLRGNLQALGITLYSLGYVNYRLAEDGQRKRIFDALAFNRECAAIPGAYREQALKNIEAIKMFYNMQ